MALVPLIDRIHRLGNHIGAKGATRKEEQPDFAERALGPDEVA